VFFLQIQVTMTTRRSTFFHKLTLLLWKNIKLKLRSPVSSLGTLCLLALFIVLNFLSSL